MVKIGPIISYIMLEYEFRLNLSNLDEKTSIICLFFCTYLVISLLVEVTWGQAYVRLTIFQNTLVVVFDHVCIQFEPPQDIRRRFTAISVLHILCSNSDNHGHNI